MKTISTEKLSTAAITMCILGTFFYCYEYYLRVAPSVMSNELKQMYALGETQFGYLAACYYYAYTPMQLPVGVMMDRFGPRRILTLACLLCAIGTYLFAATHYLWLAQVGRFIVGLGSAFAYVGVLKLSNLWLPRKYFALMAGICTTLGMIGAISGEVTMSYWIEIAGWQSTLYGAVVVGLLLTFILWLVLRDGTEEISLSSFSQGTVKFPKLEGLKEIITSPQMWINGLIGCLTFAPVSGFAEVWAVNFLQNTGMTKQEAALGSSMIFLGFAIGGPLWGIISDKIQSRRLPLIGGSFVASGLMGLAIFLPPTSLGWMYTLLFFAAFFASAEILIFAISNDLSKMTVSATAIAFANMIVMMGGIFLPPLIGTLLDNTSQNYGIALSILPLSLSLAGVLSLSLKESYQEQKR